MKRSNNMKHSFKLKNLGCAACALRMEEGINKIPGIKNARVNFITSKLSFDADSEENIDTLLSQIQKTLSGIKSECKIAI
jgi:cation transport ATPase